MISPYRTVLIQASHGAAAAATNRSDVGTGAWRARDRSVHPASGSGVKGAAGGARGGRVEGSETAYSCIQDRGREGVKVMLGSDGVRREGVLLKEFDCFKHQT